MLALARALGAWPSPAVPAEEPAACAGAPGLAVTSTMSSSGNAVMIAAVAVTATALL